MIRLNKKQKFRPSSEAKAFLQYLKERAVFGRQIDAYAFAAAYAITNNLNISNISLIGRSDMEEVEALDEEVCLALEAGIHAIYQKNNQLKPQDSQSLMDSITRYAEVGLKDLQEQWSGKTSLQIQDSIQKMIT